MVSLDPALLLGGLGFVTGAASLVYAHGQVRAARRQAEEAARATRMQTSLAMFDRIREIRRGSLDVPDSESRLIARAKSDAQRTRTSALIEQVGGLRLYYLHREIMDALQDAFFLRRENAVTDAHWRLWTTGLMPSQARDPDFRAVFEYARDENLLDAGFVAFFSPLFEGHPVEDPAAR